MLLEKWLVSLITFPSKHSYIQQYNVDKIKQYIK